MQIVISPRYSEVDVLGHVTNSAIPAWFEHGRLHFFKYFSKDKNFSDLKLILKQYNVVFHKEIAMGTDVIINTSIEQIGTTSITFLHEAFQNDNMVVEGKCTMVYFDYINKQKLQIPDTLKETLLSTKEE